MPDKKRPTLAQREMEISKRIGVSPAFAGAAILSGVPAVTKHIWQDAPHGLADILASGVPITSSGGTPLSQIAEFTGKEVRAIKRFARESGVKVPIVSGLVPSLRESGIGYFVDPNTPGSKAKRMLERLLGSKSPIDLADIPHVGLATTSLPAAFHEISHASPVLKRHSFRQALQDVGSLMGHRLPGSLARMAIGANVLAPPDEDTSRARRIAYDYAPAAVGATFLPQLLEEARASTKAIAGARRHGIGTLKAIKELTPAFGTYAGAAGVSVLATMIARNLVKALHNRGEEKQAAATAGKEISAPGLLRTGAYPAWKVGGTPPKPKSNTPNSRLDSNAHGRATAKPPGNQKYYKDLLQSLYNPQRGFRVATPG